jgi:hypothetical protein
MSDLYFWSLSELLLVLPLRSLGWNETAEPHVKTEMGSKDGRAREGRGRRDSKYNKIQVTQNTFLTLTKSPIVWREDMAPNRGTAIVWWRASLVTRRRSALK